MNKHKTGSRLNKERITTRSRSKDKFVLTYCTTGFHVKEIVSSGVG